MLKEQADQIAVGIGKAATAGGSAASGAYILGLTANEFAAFGGLFVGIIGVCIQWHYGRRKERRDAAYQAAHDKREAEYHKQRLMWREDDGES